MGINKIEIWKVGKKGTTVVTESEEGLKESTGHAGKGAKEYYGGNLVCESIYRSKDAHLIAAAPKMLEALQNLENDANQIPPHAWKMVKESIKSALGG